MTDQELKLSIPSDPNHFDRFYGAITQIVERLGLEEDERFRFAVCVSEAYTNAYLHGNKEDPLKSISLRFCWDEREVHVEIEDEGEGKLNGIETANARPDVSPEKSGGRGLGIMKRYADKLTIEERVEGGLRVNITFKLRQEAKQSERSSTES